MDDLIEEQIRYYRARAPEYDATSRPDGDPFAAITDQAKADLIRHGPVDLAIELGAGTGAFTGVIASIADRVLAVDSSPEVLDINRAAVDAPNVERIVANVFEWQPPEPASLIAFAFLLSHIPEARFDAFWEQVARMLTPGGSVFVIDETAHDLWREEAYAEQGGEIVTRTLTDGRAFRVVKVLWTAGNLSARLSEIGWQASLVQHDPFFWGTARPTA